MSENLKYWLWLQKALGAGAYIKSIIEDFGSVKKLYESNILEWRMSSALTAKQIDRLEQTDIHSVNEIIYSCEKNNWHIIDYDDYDYPERLREIINPPAVLYVDGLLPDIDNTTVIGIVGTRKASDYAVKVTHIMSRGCAEAGAVIVSGGALGVDTAAHKGALMAGGKTVAVLGCGFGTNYLYANRDLRQLIKSNGALVTEYPPFTAARRDTFPMRNRLISALSVGVLVVEAGVKSGSLITANYALEQGRDVFAIPASVLSLDFAGTNKLIDDGAMVATKPVHLVAPYANKFDSLDITKVRTVDAYIYDTSDKSANAPKTVLPSFDNTDKDREKRLEKENTANKLTGDVKAVYQYLGNSFEHIDLITQGTGLTSNRVMVALTQLELMELAQSTSGKRYKKS